MYLFSKMKWVGNCLGIFFGVWDRLGIFFGFWVGHVLYAISSISELETVTTERIHSILEFDAPFFRVVCNILDVLYATSSILELEMKLLRPQPRP